MINAILYIKKCTRCGLAATRRAVVLGRGALPCRYLFLGEAPGQSEDLMGEAFIGRAGKLLDALIAKAGIRAEDCFFTNACLCHPSDIKGGENREPTKDEILACSYNVNKLIHEAHPARVILVGKIAEFYYKRFYKQAISIQHPAFLLRNGGVKSPYWNQNLHKLEEVRYDVENPG
jgi:uracil-DNA glycosylase family 4